MTLEMLVEGGRSAVLICGMAIFAYYEVHRQWPLDKKVGLVPWFERNWPRALFTSILSPGLLTQIAGAIKGAL